MSEGKYFNNLNESKKYDGEIVCEKCGNSVNKLTYDRHLSTHREKRGNFYKRDLEVITKNLILLFL